MLRSPREPVNVYVCAYVYTFVCILCTPVHIRGYTCIPIHKRHAISFSGTNALATGNHCRTVRSACRGSRVESDGQERDGLDRLCTVCACCGSIGDDLPLRAGRTLSKHRKCRPPGCMPGCTAHGAVLMYVMVATSDSPINQARAERQTSCGTKRTCARTGPCRSSPTADRNVESGTHAISHVHARKRSTA